MEQYKWGFLDEEGNIFEATFDTADDAISYMNKQYGQELTLEKYHEAGLKLARVKITTQVVSVMNTI